MRKYLVAIFYIAGEEQGSELKLAIEGWRQHFKEDHEILVVGDLPPIEGIKWMYVERLKPKDGEYLPALDICNKLMYVCQYCNAHDYPGFIWASDDFFAVNDFNIKDVLVPKYSSDELPSKGDKTCNHWWRTQIKTRKLCESQGFDIKNWTTHLPMWFEGDKLFWLIHDYDLTENGYIVENIYYNRYPQEGRHVKLDRSDRWQFMSYYTPLDREGFKNALANKIWVCCSVNGWSDALEEGLRKHYGL